ncbi:hypothetical protein PIB30_040646 [Stylosanthes scabra]|uniref:Uncharacterized protein n=1 Tax=Stylosanthes scabra TaxID=79078 RepID=A0ABU6WCT6_9FABA|nr:hypothetical protein [Stylosanthes scabra]
MDFQPKTEPASSSTTHESFNEMSISELVSDLRANCDKVEEVFFSRDAKHKAEIGSLAVKYELERLQRLHIEDELKKKQQEYLNLERKWSELEEENKKNMETIQKLKDENSRLEKEKCNADAEKHLNEMVAVPDSSLSKKRKKGVGHCIGKSSDVDRLNEKWHIAGALDYEVLRDSANASEEPQHEQVSQPLKSVVEEEPDHSNICEDEIPKEGMRFKSCAEAHGFYKNYASKMASSSDASRKRRGNAVVVDEDTFDAHRFKTPFHEHFFNSNVASKSIIADTRFNLEEDQYPQIRQQIELRGWKRLNKPKKMISQIIIREFYANAGIDPNNEVGPRFHTFVRGMLVNFSMDRIKTIMKFEGPLNSETSYRARMVEGNQDLDAVTRDLCVEGTVWSLGARNNPLYLNAVT